MVVRLDWIRLLTSCWRVDWRDSTIGDRGRCDGSGRKVAAVTALEASLRCGNRTVGTVAASIA